MTAPRTPVLVGAAALQQREEDPERAREPLELMAASLEAAAEDARAPALLSRADSIRIPRGFWDYPDPARLLAERFGANSARSEIAEIGVLQTTLFARAAGDIAAGHSDVVLLAGGEARHRAQCARRLGVEATLTKQAPCQPDQVLRPGGEILHAKEIAAGLVMPVAHYAMIENALRAAEGQTLDAHRDEVAALWSGMSEVAARNPDAWRPEAVSAAAIREPVGTNHMLAFPYTKLHNSQWNVDQAAGLILTSVETARLLGIPRERWIFPIGIAEANQMLPLVQRPRLHRSPGFAHGGRALFEHAGLSPGGIAHRELYSCFPVAVRIQQRELGFDPGDPATVTGGMAFAGGPLNNFVLQALVRMVQVLRDDPGSRGLVNAVSGIMTKQGMSLWSSEPGPAGFASHDVTEQTARDCPAVELCDDPHGAATVASYTVLFEGNEPVRTVLVCDLEDGRRALATSGERALAERAQAEELIGRSVRLAGEGHIELA